MKPNEPLIAKSVLLTRVDEAHLRRLAYESRRSQSEVMRKALRLLSAKLASNAEGEQLMTED